MISFDIVYLIFSVQPLCSLCLCGELTTKTRRTQRLHRESLSHANHYLSRSAKRASSMRRQHIIEKQNIVFPPAKGDGFLCIYLTNLFQRTLFDRCPVAVISIARRFAIGQR